MKKKVLSILLSGVVIITLLCPSIYVKAEGDNETEESSNVMEEGAQSDDVKSNENDESAIDDQEEIESLNNENNLNPSDYDSNLFKIVLYTLGKSSDESITKDDLETITKIDIDELKEEHSDLKNTEIKSFSLLKEISNLKEINLGNVECENIEELKEIPTLEIVKINGTIIAKDLLENVSKENYQEVTEPTMDSNEVINQESDQSNEVVDNNESENKDDGNKDETSEGEVVPEDESEPENIPIINAIDKIINVGDKFDTLEGVTAKSNSGEDLTDKIEIKENKVNPNEQGKYTITYYVKDSDNKETTKTITITVQKGEEVVNTLPVINAENKVINLGSKFNELDGITATDEEDGDITNDIIILSSNVDVNKEGVYVVTYEVKDKDGGKVRKNIEVTVVKPLEKENEAPYINASDRNIKQGQSFNPLSGVNAYDTEDGDLTSKLKVIENMVDINTVGKYSVTFEVSDSEGKTTTKSINVTVDKIEGPINSAPVIYATDKVIKLDNEFDAYSNVTASDKEDGDISDKVKVIYNDLDINKTGLYRIIYEVTDSAGYRVAKEVYVNVVPKSNTRPIIYAEDIIVALGEKYNPYAMVSASDKEDGDITGKVIVVYNYVNVYKEGIYKVAYKVTDSMGTSASCVIKVKVKNFNNGSKVTTGGEVPIIYCNDISIALDSKFNPLEWVAATDKEDGDITNKVMAIYNNVNTSVEGNYHVTYEIVDSNGNKVNKAMMVVVKAQDKMNEENNPPIINANDIILEKGRYFNPLEGVTALDDEDGNLTNKIVVKENQVNVSKDGDYRVTYGVTDSKGLTTTKSINVTIESGSIFSDSIIVKVIIGVLVVISLSGVVTAIIINKKKK